MYSVLRSSLFTGMAVFWGVFGLILFVGGLIYWPEVVIPDLAWWLLAVSGGLFTGSMVGGVLFFLEYWDVRGKGEHLIWGAYATMIDAYEEMDAAQVGDHFQASGHFKGNMEVAK